MKNLVLLLAAIFTFLGVKAQEAATDYIYSSDGFEVKTGAVNIGGNIYISTGLYSKDGKTLVAAMTAKYDYDHYHFFVLDGCETICSGAFQSMYDTYVYIPSSVKQIAPDAITSKAQPYEVTNTHRCINEFRGVQDGCKEQGGSGSVNAPASDPNATEVARYNIQGVRLNEPSNGLNIVQMSDGTAEKVIVR